jgi:myo-inositol 2-dehydrogenase/D-chiro-inositol 1-dehydrogenase
MAAFIDAVQNGKPAPVSGEDGLEDMYAALAAGKSLKENPPVTIGEMRKLY